jgi:hypothetical protein
VSLKNSGGTTSDNREAQQDSTHLRLDHCSLRKNETEAASSPLTVVFSEEEEARQDEDQRRSSESELKREVEKDMSSRVD